MAVRCDSPTPDNPPLRCGAADIPGGKATTLCTKGYGVYAIHDAPNCILNSYTHTHHNGSNSTATSQLPGQRPS
jgi:hypothetical protein